MEVDAVICYLVADRSGRPAKCRTCRGASSVTLSALRNVIGQLDLDHRCRRAIPPTPLRAALDSATQQWSVKVMRIELRTSRRREIRLTMESR
jgi:regulator of protease activity HflC (stomatin/prohibitin superfamily)